MSNSEERVKLAAACRSCGSVYAAERLPDGRIIPIGRPQGCRCGSRALDPVEDRTTAD